MFYNKNTLRNIKRAFKTASIRSNILYSKKNEFGEEIEDELLITINGIFYEKTSKVNLNISTNGKITTKTYQYFMVLKNEESELIKKHMKCLIKNKKYEIIDINNEGELDVCYTLKLKRVDTDED